MFKVIFSIFLFIITGPFISCQNSRSGNQTSNQLQKEPTITKSKPPSNYLDTLKIDSKAAVFYYPDSIQLAQIKAGMDTSIFESIMHEYFYQFRYVHTVLKKYWPNIKIIEARNVRFLSFIKADKQAEIIDLNSKNDPYGLFVFDTVKSPDLLELTNAESGISFYFSK